MVEIMHLSKSFGKKEVLKDISITIEKGACTALIGKNGAGKSTLIDILIGHKHASKGSIEDTDGLNQSINMGILFQRTNFPKLIKVKELFYLYQNLYKNSMTLEQFRELTQFSQTQMNQHANDLSGGQKRLLDFALTLIGNPQFLILDEPTAAMDIETREHFWQIIYRLKRQNITILYTSHYIEEVERMADRVIYLEDGKVKIDDTPQHILSNQNNSIVEITNYSHEIHQILATSFKTAVKNGNLKIYTNEVEKVIKSLIELNFNLNNMTIHKKSLLELMFTNTNERGVLSYE